MRLKKATLIGLTSIALIAVGVTITYAGWTYINGRAVWIPGNSPDHLIFEGSFSKVRNGENELIVYTVLINSWSVNCQNNGGNIMHGVPGTVQLIATTTENVAVNLGGKSKNTVPVDADLELNSSVIGQNDPCPVAGTPGKDKFTMVPDSIFVDQFVLTVNAFRCDNKGNCATTPESTSNFVCTAPMGAVADVTFDYDCP